MADNTRIEWTDATWQPITGCQVVSPGCTNCYAMQLAGTRLRNHPSRQGLTRDSKAGPVWTGETRLNEQWLDQPLRWRRRRRIFVAAHGDLFAESVPDEWIDRVFAVMALAPQHTFQVLTKRAKRMRDYICTLAGDWMIRLPDSTPDSVSEAAHESYRVTWPLPNVWLGVSVEDQPRADERIPDLLATPASKRFLSCEPLLARIDLRYVAEDDDGHINALSSSVGPNLDWVIVGGESGANARPMHPDWARSLRDQCQAAGVPFFFKQWGEWAPDPLTYIMPLSERPDLHYWGGLGPFAYSEKVGKRFAGRLLDGREWSEFPA